MYASVVCCILLAACGGANSTATSIARATRIASDGNVLTDMEHQWQALNITNYHITHRHYSGFGAPPEITARVEVHGGVMMPGSFLCRPSSAYFCSELMHHDLTVHGLFVDARTDLIDPHCVTSMIFDASYHFPKSIDCANVPYEADYAHSHTIVDFAVLP